MNNYKLWFILSDIPNKLKIELLNLYETEDNIWEQCIKNDKLLEIKPEYSNKLKCCWNESNIEKFNNFMIKNKISLCRYGDKNYPKALLNIDDPPFNLFYKGDLEWISKNNIVAIVGSRNCTPYGVEMTKLIVKDLCKKGIGIISGGARGIDTVAHKEALNNDGKTISVLGNGIDIVYPRENYNLFNLISNKGCLMSEFLPGTPPNSYNFPRRNRIISALSDLVIVIEAGEKSGSLITANCALNQGKDVAVVPGAMLWKQSKGCNKLIKDGATPITDMGDIYELLKLNWSNSIKVHTNEIKNNILNRISDTPMHIDDIIKHTNIDIRALYELLFEMQLEDEIICLPGNFYVKVC